MRNKSQKQRVLEKLQKDGECSNIWAINNRILRLSERIREIIRDGHKIETFFVVVKGRKERSASYRIVNDV